MNPIESAQQVTPMIEHSGALGATILGASIIIVGLLAALIVVWREWKASEKDRKESEKAHYEYVLSLVERLVADEQKFTTSIQTLTTTVLSRGQA